MKLPYEGSDYWVDGTSTLQGGSIKSLSQRRLHHAMVINDKPAGLEQMAIAVPELPAKEVFEQYKLRHNFESTDTMLTIATTYRGSRAESIRRSLQRKGQSRLLDDYIEYYENRFGVVQALAPLQVVDDRVANELVLTEQYSLPQVWQAEDDAGNFSLEFIADAVLENLSLPADQRRFQPLAQPHPVVSQHKISVEMADGWAMEPEQHSVSNEFFNFDFSSRVSGKQLLLTYSINSLGNTVPVKRARKYIKDLKAAREFTYYPIESYMPEDSQAIYQLGNQLVDIGSWFEQTAQALSEGKKPAATTTSSR